MFVPPAAEDVLADLGDKIVGAVVDSTRRSRADLVLYRKTFPEWVADHSERGLANWIHDRMWAHLRRALDQVDGTAIVDQGSLREIVVGIRYRARVKRHGVSDEVRSYPTAAALAFWAQSDTLDGLEEIRLGFGYRWEHDDRQIGPAVISLRDGLDNDAIWVVEVDVAGEDGTRISWTPVDPTLPLIDLYDATRDEEAT
jgi:hypothetical protein